MLSHLAACVEMVGHNLTPVPNPRTPCLLAALPWLPCVFIPSQALPVRRNARPMNQHAHETGARAYIARTVSHRILFRPLQA